MRNRRHIFGTALRRGALALPIATAAIGVAACGSGSGSPAGGSASATALATRIATEENPANQRLWDGRRGGTLTVLDHQDFQHLDPGATYSSLDYAVVYATQRPLYSYLPNDATTEVPDLASGPPQISANGLTVTVHIRPGVHFSPPVNREVTSADVEYAIDRGANPNVGNGYFMTYFGDLLGATRAHGGAFPGVTAPSRYTVVFHLTQPTASLLVGALSLPLSAPVPAEFARPLDAAQPSRYGNFQVATGPYMIKSDSRGNIIGVGYQPGRSLTLVRNPNWNRATDFRPAYLNRIDISIGGDPTVIGRQVLAGSDMVQNDPPANSVVELAFEQHPAQMTITPGAGISWVALDNAKGPFKSVDLRRAVYAALDRSAMVKATGGAVSGTVATHFIYPTSEGFAQAGGYSGPHYDFNEHPDGDMALAAKYMKLAGYAGGRYSGPSITVIGATGDPNAELAQITNQALLNLGFHTRLDLVDESVMYARYCGVPSQEIDVCPNVGWVRDFSNPQTILDPTFNGHSIVASNNPNYGQVDDPTIDAQMQAAVSMTDSRASVNAWARIDDELVADAAAVPFAFSSQPMVESADVAGVSQQWNEGAWDYSFTSLK